MVWTVKTAKIYRRPTVGHRHIVFENKLASQWNERSGLKDTLGGMSVQCLPNTLYGPNSTSTLASCAGPDCHLFHSETVTRTQIGESTV